MDIEITTDAGLYKLFWHWNLIIAVSRPKPARYGQCHANHYPSRPLSIHLCTVFTLKAESNRKLYFHERDFQIITYRRLMKLFHVLEYLLHCHCLNEAYGGSWYPVTSIAIRRGKALKKFHLIMQLFHYIR